MKKIDKKGFSLVELLATITILGILSSTAIIAYSRYKAKAQTQAYDTLAKSAMHAMENYLMDNPGTTDPVTINKLYYNQYLDRPADSSSPENECVGNVITTSNTSSDNNLDTNNYTVIICCANYKYQYQFNNGSETPNKTEISDDNICTNIKNTTDSEKTAEAAEAAKTEDDA